MEFFESIKNDKEIIDLYNQISIKENEKNNWAHHDLNHVLNVSKLVETLLSSLNYPDSLIQDAKIAALLHDTGCLHGKENHAFNSYTYAKDYLENNCIKLKNHNLVLEAIKLHSDGFDTDNIIALALILADKLDIKYTRIAKEGYNISGMRQTQFIKDITINIIDNTLEVSFLCDNKIDKIELENFYFIPKVFKAISAFSKKFKLSPKVFFNNNRWELFDNFIL